MMAFELKWLESAVLFWQINNYTEDPILCVCTVIPCMLIKVKFIFERQGTY